MGDPIRWAISSTGAITDKFVAGLRLLPDVEIVAVGSRTQERADVAAARLDIGRSHGSLEALAADDGVDAVYVASVNSAHLADTVRYLEAGKAVLCEKPFAVNRAEAEVMVETARRETVFLMEAMWSRFLPGYERLVQLVNDGAIGEVRHVQAEFAFSMPSERTDHRVLDSALAGGALLDLGIYGVHLAHLLLGAPTGVHATARIDQGVDLATAMQLSWEHGATAHVNVAIDHAGYNGAVISGTEGVITLDPRMHSTTGLTVHRSGAEPVRIECPIDGFGYHHQVLEVHGCLALGRIESERMPWADSLAMMDTLDAARSEIGLVFDCE